MKAYTKTDAYNEEIIFMLSIIVVFLAHRFGNSIVTWLFTIKAVTDGVSSLYVAWKAAHNEVKGAVK